MNQFTFPLPASAFDGLVDPCGVGLDHVHDVGGGYDGDAFCYAKDLAMSLMSLSFSSSCMVAGKLCWMVSRGELGQIAN
ncbi:hypothetical protein [Marinomonas sp. CT5]|uniref:hypothetical protein n=1 Tax=Marinomonas sp. CT5 TaxID=2066133 RepID=UPI001BAFD0B3|nr:hypothetical protein [Marinomonas sp. CT5]